MDANDRLIGDELSPRFVTARLEVDYISPTPLGPLHLIGNAEEISDRKVIVATELVADGKVTARGRAVMVRITSA